MKCAVYKGNKNDNAYLFVDEESNFSQIPESLLGLLGPLKIVMQLDLTPDTSLAQVNADDVLSQLHETGFYLQLPAGDPSKPA